MPLCGVEFFSCARNRHAALALFLLAVHVESEGEGPLAQALGFLLQLLKLTLWKPTKLEDQSTCGCALSAVDMAADDNGKVFLLRVGWHGDCEGTVKQNSQATLKLILSQNTHVRIHTYMHMCVKICVYIHVDIHTDIRIHTCICSYMITM